ncbi:MAG: hypothetical protein HY000_13250, partial [Planctomycetes bacterium]|nr:hypothetical protein [Planctomycetota bacterium]
MPRYPRLWSIALPPAALIAIALGWHLTTPADRAAVSWPSTAAAAEAPQEIPASTASPSPPVDLNELEEDELAPGLVAIYRSLDKDHAAPQVARIDPKPAFTWGDSSPHPRIPPGPFEVVWTGVISLYERGEIRFGAYLGGDATVVIDGETVLQARGRSANDWVGSPKGISREAGLYRVRVVFRSLAGVPARIQIWWQGESFSREPLPASRLMHVKRELPEAARQEELIARGRDAVERFGCRRCHSAALPSVADFAPGPSLAGLGKRVSRRWLFDWLADPAKVRPHARMPIVFAEGREGLAERQLVADFLLKSTGPANASNKATPGDFRAGRQAFLGTGCIACHVDPEKAGPGASAEGKSAAPNDPERIAYHALADRFTPESLAAFLVDP